MNERNNINQLSEIIQDAMTIMEEIMSNPRRYLIFRNLFDDKEIFLQMESLAKTTRNELEKIIDELSSDSKVFTKSDNKHNVQKELENYGLAGEHLAFKHNLLKKFFNNFEKHKTILWLKRYLGSLEILLNSLSKIFPQIEAIFEFIGFIKNTCKVREIKTK